jgi:hypothetical protein
MLVLMVISFVNRHPTSSALARSSVHRGEPDDQEADWKKTGKILGW